MKAFLIAAAAFAATTAHADARRLHLRYFCFCQAEAGAFQPRRANVIYSDVPGNDHRVADDVFVPYDDTRYTLVSIFEVGDRQILSYPTRSSCMELFVGNEARVCDGDVRQGEVDENET